MGLKRIPACLAGLKQLSCLNLNDNPLDLPEELALVSNDLAVTAVKVLSYLSNKQL